MSERSQLTTTDRRKPRIFVGSSSEAIRRAVADDLLGRLRDDFDVNLWADSPAVGSYTLDGLFKHADSADAAIFLFCKDDARQSRGSSGSVPRDNVVFEYGLFTAQLGRDRVAVIEENGVELPSDLRGVLNHVVTLDGGDRQRATLRTAADHITRQWRHLTPHADSLAARLRLERTLDWERDRVADLARSLSLPASDAGSAAGAPVEIDSTGGCVAAYAEALTGVEDRFWTTTFLSSGFWTRTDDDIVAANRGMVRRLRANQGDVRRLFLLPRTPEAEMRSARDRRLRLRYFGEQHRIDSLDREFRTLCDRMDDLAREGCQVRVAFDHRERHELLPRSLRWNPTDSELAIYDDFRVDVFDGGSVGRILGVRSYGATDRSPVLDSASWFFEQLWEEAKPVDDFLAGMRSALESVAQYIDYEPNWLAAYEYGLNGQDSALKSAEFKFVEKSLKDRGRWGNVRRYLDIGTCTARYPVGLYRAMAEAGETIGIDADSDCKRFASKVVATKRLDRIHIRHQDFLASDLGITGQFDLVTCMLGTVSHFGYDGNEQHATELLPFALRRMHSLLATDGLLLLGTWSDAAIDNRDLLGIYSTIDRNRLSSWSPHAAEFGAALIQAGLRIVDRQMVDSRLNVWVLEPTPLAATVPAHPAR